MSVQPTPIVPPTATPSAPNPVVTVRRLTTFILLVIAGGVTVRIAWLSDDALITLRTVRNILEGFGPVWNISERVQAYTHPLWMLLLTLTSALTGELFYTPLAVSLLLSLAAIWVVVHKLAADWLSALVGGLLLLFSKSFVDYTSSGLENPLTYFLLACFIWVYRAPADRPRQVFWLTLLAALSAVNRADTILLFIPALLYVAYQARAHWRRVLVEGALGVLPLVAWAIFAVVYYGFLLPNTYYAKLNTGIALGVMVQQGLLYFVELISSDPLTLLGLVIGLALPWFLRRPSWIWLSLGSVLYTLYVIRVGGDFMSGRMLTGPYLVAVACIITWPLLPLPRLQTGLITLGVLLLGFANQAQSPWFSDAGYHRPVVDNKGVADERGHYYQRYSLLTANRLNRLNLSGVLEGTRDAQVMVHGNMGYLGFVASPYTDIIDVLALTDPLLARLPALNRADWRIGHLERHVPAGYLASRRSGENRLRDPQLAEYYRRLQTVVSGPLFTRARWAEIWRFQTGQNDALIDRFFYAHPTMKTVAWEHFEHSFPDRMAFTEAYGPEVTRGSRFGTEGVTIELGGVRHDRVLDLSLDTDWFDVVYFNDTLPAERQTVGRQTIAYAPLRLAKEVFTVVPVDAAVAEAGYTAVRVIPRLPGRFQMNRLALLRDPADPVMDGAPAHLVDLLRLYFFTFFRTSHDARTAALESLRQTIAQVPAEQWRDTPLAYQLDFVRLNDPAFHPIIDANLTDAVVLHDADDKPQLRYLGMLTEDAPEDATITGVRMRLFFEVFERTADEHMLWFYMKNQADGREYMLYDYLPARTTADWPVDVIHEVPILLMLDPGDYRVTFGFWTPDRRRLYVDRAEDVYWINLGVVEAPALDEVDIEAANGAIPEEGPPP